MTVVNSGDVGKATMVVTEEVVEKYANLTGDHNPLHIDPEYAQKSVFKSRIAHAILTNGLVSSAVTDLPGDTIFVDQTISFAQPVYLDDKVDATAEVANIRDTFRADLELKAKVDERQVLTGTATILSVDATDERLERIFQQRL